MKKMHQIFSATLFGVLIALPSLTGCGPLNPFDQNVAKRIPAVRLVTPVSDGEAVDASFQIQAEFDSVVLEDLWSLYYISTSGDSMKGNIIDGFSVTSRTITWETSEIPSGDYYFYAELTSLGGTISATSPGSISVSHNVVEGNTAPSVSFASPGDGGLVAIDSVTSIIWASSDSDSDTLTSLLEYSDDNGNTWTELSAGGSSPFSWTPDSNFVVGPNYRLRVTVEDPDGAKSIARSGRFAIVEAS